MTEDDLFALVWDRLALGVRDATAAARHPALATVGPDGAPDLRTVVLRAADRSAGTLEVHTDARSAKVAQIASDPRVAALVWDAAVSLQIRLTATATVLPGDAAAWARVPPAARARYGADPPPGTPIPAADSWSATGAQDGFAALKLTLTGVEALHLGPPHRRAFWARADGWRGRWLVP